MAIVKRRGQKCPRFFVIIRDMRALVALFLVGQLAFGCETVSLIWEPSASSDPLFRFERNGKVGFIDATGKIVIQPKLPDDTSGEFHDGLLSLGISSGPFIDRSGKRVIPDKLDRIWDFSEGLAAAEANFGKDDPWGYIDRTGNWAISPRFPSYPQGLVSGFKEGLAAVETDEKVGYINHTGTFVIPQQFVAARDFSDGAAVIAVAGPCFYVTDGPCSERVILPWTGRSREMKAPTPCRWSYIDKTGKRLFSADFDEATDFHEGLAAVKVYERWGFINKQGAFVIAPLYRSVGPFSEGLAFVEDGANSGYVDETGRLQFRAQAGERFSGGLARVGNYQTGFTYVDKAGNQAFPENFGLATDFVHGLAHVRINNDFYEPGEFA